MKQALEEGLAVIKGSLAQFRNQKKFAYFIRYEESPLNE